MLAGFLLNPRGHVVNINLSSFLSPVRIRNASRTGLSHSLVLAYPQLCHRVRAQEDLKIELLMLGDILLKIHDLSDTMNSITFFFHSLQKILILMLKHFLPSQILLSFSLRDCLLYLKVSITQKEGEAEKAFLHWFAPQTATVAIAG